MAAHVDNELSDVAYAGILLVIHPALLILEQTCRSVARCEKAIPGGLDLPPDDGLLSCAAPAEAPRTALVKKRGEGEAKELCP